MDMDRFDQLGQKVDALLSRVAQLGRENMELTIKLEDKDKEIMDLSAQVSEFKQEREQVLTKVDSLLAKIDEHETI